MASFTLHTPPSSFHFVFFLTFCLIRCCWEFPLVFGGISRLLLAVLFGSRAVVGFFIIFLQWFFLVFFFCFHYTFFFIFILFCFCVALNFYPSIHPEIAGGRRRRTGWGTSFSCSFLKNLRPRTLLWVFCNHREQEQEEEKGLLTL